tara:strand:+ start:6047 stop:7036 length:990 start_codon:yes stop_codon:yes gene_type:complete
MNSKNKIIWAIDPMRHPQDAKNIIRELKIWSKRLKCQIQPVAVFSQSTADYYTNLRDLWTKGIEDHAYRTLNSYLKKANVKNLLPAHVVFAKSLSNREMASVLSDYAEKSNTSVIFANTRAKKTWNPFRLGGFAETLVATSRVPVLLFNHAARPSKKISSILFPTNFSRDSKLALENLATMTKPLKSKITLFNQLENPSLFVPSYADFSLALEWKKMMQEAEKANERELTHLADNLTDQGVKCDSIVQAQKKSLAQDILEIASKKSFDLIALSSHQGRLSQAILGGTVRDILLLAKCPVLIFHKPKANRPRERGLPAKSIAVETSQLIN